MNEETRHKQLIRKFHTLLTLGQVSDEGKMEILAAYGVQSSKALNSEQLEELCRHMSRIKGLPHRDDPTIKWRRRVMASIGEYLRLMYKESSAPIIKGVACQASGYTDFNHIPQDRLPSLYNAFVNRCKDLKAIDRIEEANKRIYTPKGQC